MKFAVVLQKIQCQPIRRLLEEHQITDLSCKLKDLGNGKIAIPLKNEDESVCHIVDGLIVDSGLTCGYVIEKVNFNPPKTSVVSRNHQDEINFEGKKTKIPTPYQKLVTGVVKLLNNNAIDLTKTLEKDIPTHWEKHGHMVLLPGNCFTDDIWTKLGVELWSVVGQCLNGSEVAKKDVISKDGFRTPQVTLLYGENPWVECVENGIKYTYNITKCMFSVGNITEKMRIAKYDCSKETVVDLYAGIGYFTLPYLVHSKAQHLHACEWNPDAVDALKKSLRLNKVEDRCTVYEGDNKETCPRLVADRVNLGLIPSSEDGWPVACAALKHTGGFLHIHSNVETKMKNMDKIENVDLENELEAKMAIGGSNEKHDSLLKTSRLNKKRQWADWGDDVAQKIHTFMCSTHPETNWKIVISHIEHVKSYAPHVDHVVLDLECRPI